MVHIDEAFCEEVIIICSLKDNSAFVISLIVLWKSAFEAFPRTLGCQILPIIFDSWHSTSHLASGPSLQQRLYTYEILSTSLYKAGFQILACVSLYSRTQYLPNHDFNSSRKLELMTKTGKVIACQIFGLGGIMHCRKFKVHHPVYLFPSWLRVRPCFLYQFRIEVVFWDVSPWWWRQ